MKQSSKQGSSVPPIEAGQLTQLVQSGVQAADTQRQQTLAQLVELQQAKLTMLQLEHDREVQLQGATSDAVTAVQQRIDQGNYLVSTLNVAVKKAQAPLPSKHAEHYGVYGHVQNGNGEPVAGHSVKLYHRNKEIVGVEVTASDGNGYFHTRIGREQLRGLLDAKERAAADKEGAFADLALVARVFDESDKLVGKSDEELIPELGDHDHLAIHLVDAPTTTTPSPAGATTTSRAKRKR